MSYTGPGVLQADNNVTTNVALATNHVGDSLKTTARVSISDSKVQPINIAPLADPDVNIAGQNRALCNDIHNDIQGHSCSSSNGC
jgi:hypothetical protein